MRSIKLYILSFLVGIGALGAAGSTALAATLDIRDGQLHGAFGVSVGGSLFDVEFFDGSCHATYGRCYYSLNFTFGTLHNATLASQALLDQVLLDTVGPPALQFDSNPELTFGISNTSSAFIITPYSTIGPAILGAKAINSNALGINNTANYSISDGGIDLSSYDNEVYAKWSVSVVPLPATLPLYGAGLAVMGFIGWRHRRKAARG